MKIFEWLKKILQPDPEYEPQFDVVDWPVPIEQKHRDMPPLTAYETRRPEIAGSSELVEGIFYIHDGQLIPDYYSECLNSDRASERRESMYHHDFFPDYMLRKFPHLFGGEKSIPRGRVFHDMVMIDSCYARNIDLLRQIKELYRLPDGFTISTGRNYCCPKCFSTVQDSYLSWRELTAQVG